MQEGGRFSVVRHRGRFALLLAAIIGAFAVQGIATPGPAEQVVVAFLLSATLLLAMWAADARAFVLRASAVIGVVVVVASVVEAATGSVDTSATRLANLLLVTLAPPAVVVGAVRTLRARNIVTIEVIVGALCLYMLVGMFFAVLYGSIGHISGTFFANGVPDTVAHCQYFSFTTLTTTGYGDLTAATNLGHTLSVSEALLGQIYLVTIVSVIVGNLGRARRPANAVDGQSNT